MNKCNANSNSLNSNKKFTQHKFFSSALICVIKNNFRKKLTFYSQSELLKQIVFPTKTQFLDSIFLNNIDKSI